MIFSGARRFGLLLGAAVLVVAGALLVGFAAAKKAGAAEECTPAVMVVRHAEDMKTAGGPDVLSEVGRKHAQLYIKLFEKYLAVPHSVGPNRSDVKVCPIGKIIAINPDSNPQNYGPSRNPYETISPLAEDLGPEVLGEPLIHVKDAAGVSYSTVYNWNTARRKTLLHNGSSTPTSTVIAWDKQGLNPGAKDLDKSINGKTLSVYKAEGWVPLLKALPTNEAAIVGSSGDYIPERTDFYVFALQHPDTGKFGFAKAYKQCFSNDGGKTWYYRTALLPTDHPDDIKTVSPPQSGLTEACKPRI